MKIAAKYYTRVTGEPVPEVQPVSTGLRKTTARKRKITPKETVVETEAFEVQEPEPLINQYPDSVTVTVKREIHDIYDKLDLINQLKQLEKPLQKRLKVLEKCYVNLQDLEVVPNFTLPPGVLAEEPEQVMENILEAVRVPDAGVHNLADFE